MDPLNPFNIEIEHVGSLTPRRKGYIQHRNMALDQQIDDVAGAILKFQDLIKEVRQRFTASGLEEQLIIKPYLRALYFEIGQLFERQRETQVALPYYEQAGRLGHSGSMVCAKRLGSTAIFDLAEKMGEGVDGVIHPSVDATDVFELLTKQTILIDGDQKGSGVVVYDPHLGLCLVTVDHVASSKGEAFIGEQKVFLEACQLHIKGPHNFFTLNDQMRRLFDNPIHMLANLEIKVGEKVYFGGYPFKEKTALFHTGRISSIGINGTFKIDGTAVSGMSGGPIAILRQEGLYVVGTIMSESFDPIDGFSDAREEMYLDQSDLERRTEYAYSIQQEAAECIQQDPQFTKIPKGNLFILSLESQQQLDPKFFDNIWQDLHEHGVISEDGTIAEGKIISGQLGLRADLQQYEDEIIDRLSANIRNTSIEPNDVQLPFSWQEPTDSLNTVGLSLVQSLSTGVITGRLFQEVDKIDGELSSDSDSISGSESSEFEIGNKKQEKKNKKKFAQKGHRIRAEAKQNDDFENKQIPKVLYRFVSHQDAKEIKINGIVHQGTDLDEIPFLTRPDKKKAISVGALCTDQLLAIYPDKIPGLTKENVSSLVQRNRILVYKLNISIPPGAIDFG